MTFNAFYGCYYVGSFLLGNFYDSKISFANVENHITSTENFVIGQLTTNKQINYQILCRKLKEKNTNFYGCTIKDEVYSGVGVLAPAVGRSVLQVGHLGFLRLRLFFITGFRIRVGLTWVRIRMKLTRIRIRTSEKRIRIRTSRKTGSGPFPSRKPDLYHILKKQSESNLK